MSMKEQTKVATIETRIKGMVKSDKAHFVPNRYDPINTTARMLKK
jgi:cytochrome c